MLEVSLVGGGQLCLRCRVGGSCHRVDIDSHQVPLATIGPPQSMLSSSSWRAAPMPILGQPGTGGVLIADQARNQPIRS
jgi:hypothetical protein